MAATGAFLLLTALLVPTPIAGGGTSVPDFGLLRASSTLADGDLVFRRGVDAIGRIVLNYGHQPRFSHVGMVLRVDGVTMVVHALPATAHDEGGVRVETLTGFLSPANASDAGYYRLPRITEIQRQQIRDFLLSSVGRPFDMRFRYSDDRALYCTELVLKALASAGVDLRPSLASVSILTVDEPAYAPDALRRSGRIEELATSST